MALKLSNNATSTLAASITAGSTTLSIQSGDAARFPTLNAGDWHPVTVIDDLGNMEIMRCTGRAGAVLTVQRAQEGTVAQPFTAGSRIDVRLTAAAVADKVSSDEVTAQIKGFDTKAAPDDADTFLLTDSADSSAPKRTLWSALKSTLKDYLQSVFDQRYASVSSNLSDLADKAAALTNLGGLAKSGGSITGDLAIGGLLSVSKTINWGHSKAIEGGTDLNDLVAPGHYHQNTNANAGADPNYPAPYAGSLYVARNDTESMVYQLYQTYQGHNSLFFRSKYNSTWSDWRQVFHGGNFNPASKLDTGAKAADSAKLNGAGESSTGTANSIAKRNGSGDLETRLFRTTYGVSGSLPGNREFIMRGSASDPYMRPITTAAAAAAIQPHLSLGNEVYTGGSRDNRNFPVGTEVLVRRTTSYTNDRNSSSTIGIILGSANTDGSYQPGAGNGSLSGTWRAHGQTEDRKTTLFQRVA